MNFKNKNIIIISLVIISLLIGLRVIADKETIITEDNLNLSSINEYYETVNQSVFKHIADKYDIELEDEDIREFINANSENPKQDPTNKYELVGNPEVIKAIIGEKAFLENQIPNYVNRKIMTEHEDDFQEIMMESQGYFQQAHDEILEKKAPAMLKEREAEMEEEPTENPTPIEEEAETPIEEEAEESIEE